MVEFEESEVYLSMLSKAKIKYIKSLHLKKNRLQDKLFVVEGAKIVLEFLESSFNTEIVFGTESFRQQYNQSIIKAGVPFELAEEHQLKQAGTLVNNNMALAIVNIPNQTDFDLAIDQWTIVLDSINDPGNLGTIIRIADWYGIQRVVVSETSVDTYNPKVVSASKGSLARVEVSYANLFQLLSQFKGRILGADMAGKDIHALEVNSGGVLLMGSESHGISNALKSMLTDRVTIPRVGEAESLNVAVATAIICDNLIGKAG